MHTALLTLVAHAALGIAPSAAHTDADAVRAIVAEMMADAETRSSLVSTTGGHDGRFFIASEDGRFRMNLHGFMQFRYTANWRDGGSDIDDFESGFSVARSRHYFEGHLWDDIAYRLRFGFSDSTGSASLEQAFLTFSLPDEWKLRIGQFQLALFRDEWIEAQRQLAVNSSPVNVLFGQGQSQGLQASRQWDDVRIWGAFSDGLRTNNTALGGNSADAALTGRVEWKLAGEWSRFDDYTSFRGSDLAILFGAAFHWETERPLLAQLATDHLVYATVDLGIEGDGWNLFAAGVYAYREGTLADDPTINKTNDAGLILQGGVFLTDQFEVFARYDHYFADSAYAEVNDISTYTLGINYYFFSGSHALKLTSNVLYAADSVNGTALENNNSVGLRTSEDDQLVFQLQLQIIY